MDSSERSASPAGIQPGMPVLTVEGELLGSVTALDHLYLQCSIPGDNRQHFIPLDAVDQVSDAVRLHLTHREVLGLL